jgi:hypothetical protein
VDFGKVLVFVNGVLFIGFGLGFIVAPSFFSSLFTGATLSPSSALIDVRSTYGALGLGVGVWLLFCFKDNVRLGLVGSLVVLASIIVGRVAGLIVDGNPNTFMYVFLGAEVVFFLATLYVVRSAHA